MRPRSLPRPPAGTPRVGRRFARAVRRAFAGTSPRTEVGGGGTLIDRRANTRNVADRDDEPEEGGETMGVGIAIGLPIGVALGVAMDDLAVGIAIELAVGLGIGVAWSQRADE